MPGPGEQHRAAIVSVNPFEEVKPHVSEYTAKEIATLSSRLEKQLGPEYISSRPGAGGGKVHYLSADKCINLANEVFGFNGWSSGIQNIQVDFVDEHQSSGKISLGLSVIVRVTLRDGTYHEDVGYGHIENCKGKAAAFEKAKKEGTTDALKRALRNFGNMLGNCVYDKDYVARVTKLKVAPSKWDPDNLHRHPDFAPKKEPLEDSPSRERNRLPVKKESSGEPGFHALGEPDDEFGSDEFDEVDLSVSHGEHPDEIVLETSVNSAQLGRRSSLPGNVRIAAGGTTPTRTVPQSRPPPAQRQPLASLPTPGPQTPYTAGPTHRAQPNSVAQGQQPPQKSLHLTHQGHTTSRQPQNPPPPLPSNLPYDARLTIRPEGPSLVQQPNQQIQNSHPDGSSSSDSSNTADHEPPIGFFTARAAESVQNVTSMVIKAPAFDPHLESPSIRKTAGVDHTKTKPVGREILGAPPMPAPGVRSSFVNPQADKTRRVGMPMGAVSPLQNRGLYKLPQMKRPAEGVLMQPQPLKDVTAASVNVPPDGGSDAKRQKAGPNQAVGSV